MPHSKYRNTSYVSDESVYWLNLSLGSCQGYNWEAIMLQEALATTTQPIEEKKSNSRRILYFAGKKIKNRAKAIYQELKIIYSSARAKWSKE